jgi:hypothetical protein
LSAADQLGELHARAARNLPRKPSPEKAAEYRERAAKVDPVLAWERVTAALRPEVATPELLDEVNALWARWDAETDVHAKALLQMELGEYVASLLEHGEALLLEHVHLVTGGAAGQAPKK